MPTVTFRSWKLVTAVLTVGLFLNALAVILTMYYHINANAYISYGTVMDKEQSNVALEVGSIFSPMVTTTLSIKENIAELKFCDIPLDDPDVYEVFDYTPLINIQNVNSIQEKTQMQSIGVISVDGAGTSNPDFSNKISFEMALDLFNLGCSDYVYAVTDNTTSFVGFCAYKNGSVDVSRTVYTDRDTGTTPEEQALFTDKSMVAIVTPIFLLVGRMSVTYERSHWCDGGATAYAVTLAQKNLEQLNLQMSKLQVGKTGVGYLVEQRTGYLVATTIGEPVIVDGTSLVNSSNAVNHVIRRSADVLLGKSSWQGYTSKTFFKEDDGLLIDVRPLVYDGATANIGWLSVVAVPSSDYEGETKKTAGWGVLAACICGLIVLILLNVFFHCAYTRPMENPKLGTIVTEIEEGREKLLSGGNN